MSAGPLFLCKEREGQKAMEIRMPAKKEFPAREKPNRIIAETRPVSKLGA